MTTIFYTNKDYDTNGNGRWDYENQHTELLNKKFGGENDITAIWVNEENNVEPQVHCDYGPAIILPQGYVYWFIFGEEVTFDEWFEEQCFMGSEFEIERTRNLFIEEFGLCDLNAAAAESSLIEVMISHLKQNAMPYYPLDAYNIQKEEDAFTEIQEILNNHKNGQDDKELSEIATIMSRLVGGFGMYGVPVFQCVSVGQFHVGPEIEVLTDIKAVFEGYTQGHEKESLASIQSAVNGHLLSIQESAAA